MQGRAREKSDGGVFRGAGDACGAGIRQDKSANTRMQILRDRMKAGHAIPVAASMRSTGQGAKTGEAIPATKAARTVQIERKIRPAVRCKLVANVPSVQ
jgi:hypothetical protein